MKPKLLTAANHDIMLHLYCDCRLRSLNTNETQIVKIVGVQTKLGPIKSWFDGESL